MNISASSTYDFQTIREFTRCSLYIKNANKSFKLYSVFFSILMMIMIAEMFLFGIDSISIALLLCAGIAELLQVYLFFILPKIRYRAMDKMRDIKNTFIFSDTGFLGTSKGTDYEGQSDISYSLITKIVETDKYLFIYQNKTQALIIDKATIEGGTVTDIKNVVCSCAPSVKILYK